MPHSYSACMHSATPPTVVNVGCKSTNYRVISAGTSRVVLDMGWPGTMRIMRNSLDRMGIPLSAIRLGIAAHFHCDHAGLAHDLMLAGVPLLVAEHAEAMARWTRLRQLCATQVSALSGAATE